MDKIQNSVEHTKPSIEKPKKSNNPEPTPKKVIPDPKPSKEKKRLDD